MQWWSMLLFHVTNAFFVWMQIHKAIINNITFIVKKLCEEIEFSPVYYVVFIGIWKYILNVRPAFYFALNCKGLPQIVWA